MSGLTDTRQDVINTVLYSLYGPSDKLAYSNGHNAEIRDHFNTFGPGITQELYGLPEDDQRIVVAAVIDGMISGLHPGEMRTLLHNLDVYDVVAPDVNKAMDLVRGMAKEDVAIIPESIRPDRKTLATADHIAWRVHGSQIRESGGSYYKHPQAVAAMTLAAFQQLRSEGYQIDDEQISAFLTVCLTHDAAEDTNRSRRYFEGSLHAKMQAFSPLEVRYVCMATDSPYGDDVAYSLYMLTRHKLPGRLEYLPYVRRGLPDIGFRVAKSADLQHNTVDPRPITSEAVALKVAEKNVLYEAAKLLVRDESSASTPLQDANVPQNDGRTAIPSPPWEARYHELITATSSEQLPGMVAALGTYIYGAGLPAHWLHTA